MGIGYRSVIVKKLSVFEKDRVFFVCYRSVNDIKLSVFVGDRVFYVVGDNITNKNKILKFI